MRREQLRDDRIQQKTFDQIDEVLFGLNSNTTEFTNKASGHGHNLKENIEALKGFVRPQIAVQGLVSMVDTVLDEFDK